MIVSSRRTRRLRALLVGAVCLGIGGTTALAQDGVVRELEPAADNLGWSAWVSDVPAVDLTGLWHFLESASDPMIEVWQGRAVAYEISQQTDRLVMSFRPENGEPSVQQYRWNGSVNAFARGGAEVRERAHWVSGGRVLEIEGRWWPADDRTTVTEYTFRYSLESARRLLFRQIDQYGETAWRFDR